MTLKNRRHEEFCWQYVIDFNGARAARDSGYSKRTAKVAASKLMTRTNIQKRIEKLLIIRRERPEVIIHKRIRLEAHKQRIDIRGQGRVRSLQKYNLTLKEYNTMLEAQGGKCAICKLIIYRSTKGGSIYRSTKWGHNGPNVDHNHTTGKTRGILCHECNVAIGGVKDNLEIARALVAYLEKYK
ncbi:terminase small subunit [bacterium]|nr:terminase small subunit [bacterium]